VTVEVQEKQRKVSRIGDSVVMDVNEPRKGDIRMQKKTKERATLS
jgi:hypothetical protein